MKSAIKKFTKSLLLVPAMVLGLGFVMAPTALAACDPNDPTQVNISGGVNCAQGDNVPTNLFDVGGERGLFTTVVNILLFIVGAIAVIMLIVGGIRYVVSGGDQNAVTAAKNTILYAIIGIIVALLAFAVVNFVITGLTPQ